MTEPEPNSVDIEILQLRAGLRKVARKDLVPAEKAGLFADGLKAQCLRACVVPFFYDWNTETGEFDYNPAGGMATVLAARDERDLFEAAGYLFLEIFSVENLRGGMGSLLGYPECCIQEFRTTAYYSDADRAVAALNKTEGVLCPLLNQYSHDSRFITHFPCRYDCAESIKMAETLVEFPGKDIRPEAPDWKSVGFLFADGAHVLVRGEASGMTVAYKNKKPIHGTDSEFIALLRKGVLCRVEDSTLRVFKDTAEVGAYSRNCEVFIFNWGGPNIYPPGHFNSYLESLKITEPDNTGEDGWSVKLKAAAGRAVELLNSEISLMAFHSHGKEAEMLFAAGRLEFRLNARPRAGARNTSGFLTRNFIIRKYIEVEERCKNLPALADAVSRVIKAIAAADAQNNE